MDFRTYPALLHHSKLRVGEYLVIYTLLVTKTGRSFSLSTLHSSGPLELKCSASDEDTALRFIEDTVPFDCCVAPKITSRHNYCH